MVSIIASPTKSVREIVPAASGWRAMASMAAATARPSASAGPMEPTETAKAAPIIAISLASMKPPLSFFPIPGSSTDKNRSEDCKNVSLHEANQNLERHERDGHEKPRHGQD